jgi:ribosomal protein L37AE/L43A
MNTALPNAGIVFAIKSISQHFEKAIEKAAKPKKIRWENPAVLVCPNCEHGEIEDEDRQLIWECRTCNGTGEVPNPSYTGTNLTVLRDGLDVHVQVDVNDGVVGEAYVTEDAGEYKNGYQIELSWEEQWEAKQKWMAGRKAPSVQLPLKSARASYSK